MQEQKKLNEEEKRDLIRKIHNFGHFGINHVLNELKEQGYSWKNMKEDITKFIRECKICAAHNPIKRGYHPTRTTIAIFPMDQVAIDLAGKIQKSKDGFQYVLIVVDVATKYVWIRCLYSKQTGEVISHLVKIFSAFGFPKIVSSDRGTEFINDTMNELKNTIGFEHRVTSAYHPRANGICERTVQTTIRTLKKLLEDHDKDDWSSFVPAVELAINCRRSSRTNSTPFSLMFGRPHNRFEDFSKVESSILSEEELIEHWRKIYKLVYPRVHKEVELHMKKTNEKIDERNKIVEFKPGDKVFIEIKPTIGSKLDPRWEGPYEIVHRNKGGAYKVKDKEGILLRRLIPPSQIKLFSKEKE